MKLNQIIEIEISLKDQQKKNRCDGFLFIYSHYVVVIEIENNLFANVIEFLIYYKQVECE